MHTHLQNIDFWKACLDWINKEIFEIKLTPLVRKISHMLNGMLRHFGDSFIEYKVRTNSSLNKEDGAQGEILIRIS